MLCVCVCRTSHYQLTLLKITSFGSSHADRQQERKREMAVNYSQWSVEEVTNWLETINLHSLIPAFEKLNITGPDLPQLDDAFMRENLHITKPAEMAALKGALSALTDPGVPVVPLTASKPTNRKVSNQPGKPVERERSGSFDGKKTYPQMTRNMSTFNPTTMPRNFTVSSGEKELVSGTREPRLKKGASAPEVLDDRCRYSGWIRKQGGSYKSCEYALVCCVCTSSSYETSCIWLVFDHVLMGKVPG